MPSSCPRGLARPGGVCRASSGGPDPAPAQATPSVAPYPTSVLLVAASVLALSHSVPRACCCGDGISADRPANGERKGGRGRRRLVGRARNERTRLRCHAAAVVESAVEPGTPSGGGGVLLLRLRNYRVMSSMGLDKLSLVAFGVVVVTGAGPNLVRRSALAPDWLLQVVTSKKEEQVLLLEENDARLRTGGTVMLWRQTSSRIVPVTVLVVDDQSDPVILGCTFIDEIAHATLS